MLVPTSYPGVFIEERSIVGVPTSIAAFVGAAAAGPMDEAVTCRSAAEFERQFGTPIPASFLADAVRDFFANGGAECRVVRLAAVPGDPGFAAALAGDGIGTGVYALDRAEPFNLLNVPGCADPAPLAALQAFCRARLAFLLVDSVDGQTSAGARMTAAPPVALTGPDAVNAAYYFPWIVGTAGVRPPCGAVAGIYARTDASHGVWKAPTGTDARLDGNSAPILTITDAENGALNSQGVNCIRAFPARGTLVWGARTLRGADGMASEWKYVPVRRTALFIEASLEASLKWTLFEPNDERLWSQIRLSAGTFMNALFRQGAFQGASPREAYFIKCDATTTTAADIGAGFANLVVGFAPLKPAEFIVITLQLATSAP